MNTQLDSADRNALYTSRWNANFIFSLCEAPGENLVETLEKIQKAAREIDFELSEVLDDSHPTEYDAPQPCGRELTDHEKGMADRVQSGEGLDDLPTDAPRVAIIVGHNEGTGARSLDGEDEWTYNAAVADVLQKLLVGAGVDAVIFIRNPNVGYIEAMRQLGEQVNEFNPALAVSLHFNAFDDESANGVEFLHYGGGGKTVAKHLRRAFHSRFPSVRLRGGGIKQRTTGRGARLFREIACDVVLCEPFFATNQRDWERFNDPDEQAALAEVYSEGILSALHLTPQA